MSGFEVVIPVDNEQSAKDVQRHLCANGIREAKIQIREVENESG
jgi:hypothetical protein